LKSVEKLVEELNKSLAKLPGINTLNKSLAKLPGINTSNGSNLVLQPAPPTIKEVAEVLNQTSELLANRSFNITKALQDSEASVEKIDEELEHEFENVTKFLNSSLEQALANASEVVKDGFEEAVDKLGGPARLSEKLKEELHNLTGVKKKELRQEEMKSLNITDVVNLRPNVDLHNGNRCADDEEEHAGLCYKTCGRFLEGRYPFRISAWQCCKHKPPCEKSDIMTSGQPCSGFGVSGDSMGNGCPHSPGGCFKDEELFGDVCYLRCGILTYGVLPYRGSPVACCNASQPLTLLEAGACDTDLRYDVGGGLGGGEGGVGTRSMPNSAHPPMPLLMERDGGW